MWFTLDIFDKLLIADATAASFTAALEFPTLDFLSLPDISINLWASLSLPRLRLLLRHSAFKVSATTTVSLLLLRLLVQYLSFLSTESLLLLRLSREILHLLSFPQSYTAGLNQRQKDPATRLKTQIETLAMLRIVRKLPQRLPRLTFRDILCAHLHDDNIIGCWKAITWKDFRR